MQDKIKQMYPSEMREMQDKNHKIRKKSMSQYLYIPVHTQEKYVLLAQSMYLFPQVHT